MCFSPSHVLAKECIALAELFLVTVNAVYASLFIDIRIYYRPLVLPEYCFGNNGHVFSSKY